MKTRRVTLEIDVPLECTSAAVLVITSGALSGLGIRNKVRTIRIEEDADGYLPEVAKEDM